MGEAGFPNGKFPDGKMAPKGVKWLEAIAPFLGGVLCSLAVMFIRHALLRLLLAVLSLSPLYLWLIHR
jgi:hypothetical protein